MKYSKGQKSESTKKVADHRGPKTITDSNTKETPPVKKRSDTVRQDDASKRCHMHVSLFMSEHSGNWYLMPKSDLQHSFHGAFEENSRSLNESHLTEEQHSFMRLMYNQGIGNQAIANIMTDIVNKAGLSGEFLAETIRNINVKCQAVMDEIAGISANMSLATETIKRLNE